MCPKILNQCILNKPIQYHELCLFFNMHIFITYRWYRNWLLELPLRLEQIPLVPLFILGKNFEDELPVWQEVDEEQAEFDLFNRLSRLKFVVQYWLRGINFKALLAKPSSSSSSMMTLFLCKIALIGRDMRFLSVTRGVNGRSVDKSLRRWGWGWSLLFRWSTFPPPLWPWWSADDKKIGKSRNR